MLNTIVETLKPFNEIIGVAGIIIGAYLYFKAKREKRPCYICVTYPLIEGMVGALPEIRVLYGDKSVERVTVSRFYFWNAGKETIRKTDITPAAPLSIRLAVEGEILDAQIIHQTEPACMCRLGEKVISPESPTLLPISFDYLDHNDGLIIQIVHNGPSNIKTSMSGKIIGAKKIDAVMWHERPWPKNNNLDLDSSITNSRSIMFFGSLFFGLIAYAVLDTKILKGIANTLDWFVFVIFGLISALCLFISTEVTSMPKNLARPSRQ